MEFTDSLLFPAPTINATRKHWNHTSSSTYILITTNIYNEIIYLSITQNLVCIVPSVSDKLEALTDEISKYQYHYYYHTDVLLSIITSVYECSKDDKMASLM